MLGLLVCLVCVLVASVDKALAQEAAKSCAIINKNPIFTSLRLRNYEGYSLYETPLTRFIDAAGSFSIYMQEKIDELFPIVLQTWRRMKTTNRAIDAEELVDLHVQIRMMRDMRQLAADTHELVVDTMPGEHPSEAGSNFATYLEMRRKMQGQLRRCFYVFNDSHVTFDEHVTRCNDRGMITTLVASRNDEVALWSAVNSAYETILEFPGQQVYFWVGAKLVGLPEETGAANLVFNWLYRNVSMEYEAMYDLVFERGLRPWYSSYGSCVTRGSEMSYGSYFAVQAGNELYYVCQQYETEAEEQLGMRYLRGGPS